MSVRNILDGTIPVGGSGGLTPESEIVVKNVSALENITTQSLSAIKQISVTTPKSNTIITAESITTPALTVGSLNLFANDQVIDEITQIDFTDESRTITGVMAKVDATWLAITQHLHLFQLTLSKLTGIPASLKELTLTVPKIKPSYTFTLYDAVTLVVDDSLVLASLTIEATKDVSLVVTITFPSALENPSALSVRFLREMS